MTYLRPIAQALGEMLRHEVTTQTPTLVLGMPARVPTIAQQVNATGLHPIADGRNERGRHAKPWTADGAAWDAMDALDGGPEHIARHRSREFFGGAFALLLREVHQAEWTLGVLTDDEPRMDDEARVRRLIKTVTRDLD